MPSIADLLRTAKLDRDRFNNLRRSGRIDDWPAEDSQGFALRIGFWASLWAAGFSAQDAVAMADSWAVDAAKSRELPDLVIFAGLEGPDGKMTSVYSSALDELPLSKLWPLMAADTGRQVIGDHPPDHEADAAPEADVLAIIRPRKIAARIAKLFEGGD